MRLINKLLIVSSFLFAFGCATSSNIETDRYAGSYKSTKNDIERFVIEYSDGLYHIKYNDPDNTWVGVGYERGSKIVAVLKHTDESDDAEFLNISFPGNNQLFVVARNLEGGYLRDEYFEREN